MVKVERLSHKLTIMSFIGNFYDTLHHLQPVSTCPPAQATAACRHARSLEISTF